MTVIVFRKTGNGDFKGFNCIGHAGHQRFFGLFGGQDIVCSAISMLVINTLNSLEHLCGTKFRQITNEEAGLIDCTFEEELNEQETLLMRALELGLTAVQNEYGEKYCKVKFEEV